MPTIKILGICDLHFGSNPDGAWTGSYPAEYRMRSTKGRRLQEAIDMGNAVSVDLALNLGDCGEYPVDVQAFVDGTINGIAGEGTETGLSCPMASVVGNWEAAHYGVGWSDYADYFADIDTEGTLQPARENPWPSIAEPDAYTFEENGFRFIVLFNAGSIHYVGQNPDARIYEPSPPSTQLYWLEHTALNTDLPCIILTHSHLTEAADWFAAGAWKNGYAHYGDHGEDATYLAPVRAVLEAAGNVQLVMAGHFHWGARPMIINDIPYLHLGGSSVAIDAADGVTANRYAIIEITTGQLRGVNQMRSAIKVTGYVRQPNINLHKFLGVQV